MPETKRFVIFDGHAIIYRAYHAFPGLSTQDGTLVNAVYGFSRILLTALKDLNPDYVAVAFDHKGPTLRSESYIDYKAHRPEMPDDLKPQIELVKEVVDALNIPRFELQGYEADDLIGTISKQLLTEDNLQTIIVTGDKDLFQLVDEHVHVWMPARGKKNNGENIEYDAKGVQEKMGVTPEQIIDLKALMGDSSDNIPGVKGVGAKTAGTLIQTFGSLDAVYARVAELETSEEKDPVIKGAVFTKLQADKDNAYLSQQLATIERKVPIEFSLEPCTVASYDKEKVSQLFEKLDFNSLISLLPKDEFELGIQDALF